MEEYVTLTELYVFDKKPFKKNLKSFIKTFKVSESDMVVLKAGKVGIKKNWIKKNIPSFNLNLEEFKQVHEKEYFNVKVVLEKYRCKNFNPISLNLDSTTVKYFKFEGCRTPFFTIKGLMKIMVLFNDISGNIYNWIYELSSGKLVPYTHNLHNVVQMVTSNHIPVFKKINNRLVPTQLYDVDGLNDLFVVDFKKMGELDELKNIDDFEKYKCPLFSCLQNKYLKDTKDLENRFNSAIKEIKQEKIIEHLQTQLENEKCLKDQVLSLTQSFIPYQKEGKIDPPKQLKVSSSPGCLLKPSKIK